MPLLVGLVVEYLSVARRDDLPIGPDVREHDEFAAGTRRPDLRFLQFSEML